MKDEIIICFRGVVQLASYDICREKEKWLQIIRIFFPGKGKATGSFNTAKGRERERLKEREREGGL